MNLFPPALRLAALKLSQRVFFLLLPLASVAFGQVPDIAPAAQQPVSLSQTLLNLALSPTGLGTIISVVFGAVGLLLGTNEVRRRRVALAVYHAFHIVEDLDAESDNPVVDKVAAGLKAADDYMKANGWRTLKPGEQQVAKLGFSSMNGESKLAEKVANPDPALPPVAK